MNNCRKKRRKNREIEKGVKRERDKKKIKFFFVHLRKCVVNKEWWVGPDVRTRTEGKRGLQIR